MVVESDVAKPVLGRWFSGVMSCSLSLMGQHPRNATRRIEFQISSRKLKQVHKTVPVRYIPHVPRL